MVYDRRGNKNPKWRGGAIKFRCLCCDKESTYQRGKRIKKYCSHKCYIGLKIKNRNYINCGICGKSFYRVPAHAKRVNKNLCSIKCRSLAQTGDQNTQYNGGPIHRDCIICGKPMILPRKDRAKTVTCGKKCRSERLSRLRRKEKIKKNCEICGAEFLVSPSGVYRKCCSLPCSNEMHSRKLVGKGNGRYVHGLANAPYPADWNKSHKRKIRERDNHLCQLCGVGQTKKDHDVHHINYIKDDISEDNLITLCRPCHGGVHGNIESRKKWKEKLSNLLKKSA